MKSKLLMISAFTLFTTIKAQTTCFSSPDGIDNTWTGGWSYKEYVIPAGLKIDSVYMGATRTGFPTSQEDFIFSFCAGTTTFNVGTSSNPFNYATDNNSEYNHWINLTSFNYSATGVVRVYLPVNAGAVWNNLCFATSLTSTCTPNINTGLVAQYNFTGNANDLSGTGNNGTVNGATLVADRFGNANSAYSFDGVNNYIEVPDNSNLQFTSNTQTISFWMKIPQIPNPTYEQAIFEKMNQNLGTDPTGNSAQGFKIIFSSNGDIYYAIKSGNASGWGSVFISSNNLIANQYQHLVFTNDNDSLRSFINNIKVNSTKIPTGTVIGTNNSPFLIGKELWTSNGNNMDYFDGILDNISVYERALSVCDIDNLFNMPNSISTEISNNISNAKESFKVYPNPANEKITILFNSNESKNINIELFDLLGNSIQSTSLSSSLGENKIELNLIGIAKGVYIVKVGNTVQKLQITK